MAQVVGDAELLLDQFANASGGPQVGVEPRLARSGTQELQELAPFALRQPALRHVLRLGSERLGSRALLAGQTFPLAHRLAADSYCLGDVLDQPAFGQQFHGPPPTGLQCFGGSWRSHP